MPVELTFTAPVRISIRLAVMSTAFWLTTSMLVVCNTGVATIKRKWRLVLFFWIKFSSGLIDVFCLVFGNKLFLWSVHKTHSRWEVQNTFYKKKRESLSQNPLRYEIPTADKKHINIDILYSRGILIRISVKDRAACRKLLIRRCSCWRR